MRGDFLTKISVKDLHERDVLAKPVENDNGNILLFEGAEINEDHIERLIKNGIDSVYVQDEDDNKKTDALVIKEQIKSYETILDAIATKWAGILFEEW